jgi:hypothetical protein
LSTFENAGKQELEVLITVKTYPIPSATYDELVCTAGVTKAGDFIRLYPINFRELPYTQQYQKYQWISVLAEKHQGRDVRKESFRPDCDSLRPLGKPILTRKGDWSERAKYALAKKSLSMEDLYDKREADRTSLGIFRPRKVHDLVVTPVAPDELEWKPAFKAALNQARLWETRMVTRQPPRKVPFKFQYKFECDDTRCKKNHQMMIEDWEVGALYWRLVDQGTSPQEACEEVKHKFLEEICGPDKETHFYVGTILAHPKTWVIIGTFYPKKRPPSSLGPSLFDGMA